MSIEEINALREQVTHLIARLDELESEHRDGTSPTGPQVDVRTSAAPSSSGVSRRHWVRGAAAIAVGGTAAMVAGARPAAAATPDPILIGVETNTSVDRTRADYTGTATGVGFLFQSGTAFGAATATFPAALGGYTTRTNQRNGIYGFSSVDDQRASGVTGVATGPTATGVVGLGGPGSFSTGVSGRANGGAGLRGDGGYGLVASGQLAAVNLVPTSTVRPTESTDFHEGGELYVRAASDSGLAIELWFCTVGGTPGTWTQVAGPDLPGQFHAVTPTRVYDSRVALPAPGILSGGANRVVDISLGRNLETGASTGTLVPEGAGAISFNLAVADTIGGGFLSVAPSFVTEVGAATINWSATGQVLNNGSITRIGNDRKVKVFAGGGSTNFVLDITGYWI